MYPEPIVPRGCDKAQIIQVIETQALKGKGDSSDPVRTVVQYWSIEGILLATYDPADSNNQNDVPMNV